MRRQSGLLIRLALHVLDAGLLLAAVCGAYALRFHSGLIPVTKGTPGFGAYLPTCLFATLLSLLLFGAHGLYGERARLGRLDEGIRLARAVSLAFVAVTAATFFYREISFSRLWLALAWGGSLLAVGAGRLAVRAFEGWLYRRGVGVARVAIVGTGETGRGVFRKLQERPALGLVPVGFLQGGADAASPSLAGRTMPLPAPLLGDWSEVGRVARELDLGLLVVTEPPPRREDLLELVAQCQGAGIECRLVPDLFSLMTSGATVIELDGLPLISLRGTPFRTVDRALKRALDLAGSVLGLLVLAPVFAAIALAIRLESPGPVFFRQRRVGHDGRVFDMFKFRSMRRDAETRTGAVWAREEDPRATRVGRGLRRTSLDELPQLYNVLRGEMSLVGPRPEREPFVRLFQGTIPRYLERLQVRSGMTGWAQVNGLRGNTSIEARTMHDIYYAENWSVGFDLRILLLTVGHLVRRLARRRPAAGPAESELEPERVARELGLGPIGWPEPHEGRAARAAAERAPDNSSVPGRTESNV